VTRRADAARRENAKKSTGPRTLAGKRRISQNARRHGLSVPLHLDPTSQPRIHALAQLMSREGESKERQNLALEIAEVQLHLQRIRNLRVKLLDAPVIVTRRLTKKLFNEMTRAAKTEEEIDATAHQLISYADNGISETLDLSLPEKLSRLADELWRLDRYERRALSRRKNLIREYDAIGR